ncbi:acyltransferase [Intrasporangium calvum]|uniref:Acyltransferase n=1 Tax=Intrasporangium calvum TaxID=53358 RepID=A0ABT5GDA0_9MICO|nr:acyltransferase [Intrasporangium calvum]MDC5695865.1 acyltransferase [Intrasporangium calvum]
MAQTVMGGAAQAVEPTRFAALDGLRAVGALAVLTTHVGFHSGASLNGPAAGLLSRLDAGVALFFVISGYLLYRPHAMSRMTGGPGPVLTRYLMHRCLRILPAFWLAVLGAALLMRDPTIDAYEYLRIATFTQIYTPSASVPGLTQMWSLSTEIAFYLALPLIAVLLARVPGTAHSWAARSSRILLVAIPAAVAWIVWVHVDEGAGHRGLWLPAFLGWFGVGMGLAVWNAARTAGVRRAGWLDHLAGSPGTCYGTAGALYLVLSTRLAGPLDLAEPTLSAAVVKNLGYAILGGLLVLPAVRSGPAASHSLVALTGSATRQLGAISYGIFCYHLIALDLAERMLGHATFDGQFVELLILTTALTLPMAWLSHRFVELPVMRWGRRYRWGAPQVPSVGRPPSAQASLGEVPTGPISPPVTAEVPTTTSSSQATN